MIVPPKDTKPLTPYLTRSCTVWFSALSLIWPVNRYKHVICSGLCVSRPQSLSNFRCQVLSSLPPLLSFGHPWRTQLGLVPPITQRVHFTRLIRGPHATTNIEFESDIAFSILETQLFPESIKFLTR